VVIANEENDDGYRYLAPYRVPEDIINRVKRTPGANAPDYMIPQYFVPLEKMPLTPMGNSTAPVCPNPEPIPGQETNTSRR
jgi:hypothetical protein